MIKIVHVIGRLTYGGAETLLLDLCRKIDKSKFQAKVYVLQDDNPLEKQFHDAGIEVEFFHKNGKFDFSVIDRLVKSFKKDKPKIVHTHLFAADFWGGRAALKAKVPHLISTKHDILSEGFWRNYFGRKIRQKFEKVIAISKATQEYLIKQEKLDVHQIEVIYNGIDRNKFLVEKPSLFRHQGLVIGSVGRLSKEKGHKHLVRACRLLKNRNWKLVLVGSGPLEKELKNSVRHLGIEDKVSFVGAVDDVRPWLEKMDVFVLPSVSEGLSLAVLEAALAGKFLVATHVGGVPEIIQNKENGLLFKPKNIEQLVRHLNWVDDHRELSAKMASRLQSEVAEKFDINKIIKQYQALYENLTSK